jgi:hypothetical protein
MERELRCVSHLPDQHGNIGMENVARMTTIIMMMDDEECECI